MRTNQDRPLSPAGGGGKMSNSTLMCSCVKKLRERYPNWSSSQIANKVGIGRATLNRIENGLANPSVDTMIKLLSSSGEQSKISFLLTSEV